MNKKNEEGKIEYERKEYKWNVGDIDKDIHIERYTPIYTSTEKIISR